MPGYGGQSIALNAETPFELQSGLAAVQQQQTKSQLDAALAPLEIAAKKSALEQANVTLAGSRKINTARSTAIDQGLIANAASLATTPEEWDKAMKSLADQGVDEAGQFIGRYSEQLKGRVATGYSAANPSSALSAMESDSPTGVGGVTSGLEGPAAAGVSNGAGLMDYDKQLAAKSPQELQTLYQSLERTRDAVERVAKSATPSQTWDQEATAMGHPDWVGRYTPQALQQLAQGIVPLDNYLRGRLTREAAGFPSPKIPARIENINGRGFAINETDPAHPSATPITPEEKGNWQPYTASDGTTKLVDTKTGEVKDAGTSLTGRPGGAGSHTSVFQLKQEAYLHLHPGDEAGALDYASGKKDLTTAQASQAATNMADKDLSALSLAGTPPTNAEAWLKAKRAEYYAALTTKGEASAPAGPAGPPPAMVARMKEGIPTTFANGQQWQLQGGKPVRVK